MQVTETSAEGLKREFKIVVPAAEIDQKIQTRLGELAGQVKLPGFRPGKVPIGLMKKRYGQAVRKEVLEDAIQTATQQTFTERNLRPALRPKVDIASLEEGTDLEYTVAVELLPEIAPVDFSQVEIERPVATVTDDIIDESLNRLAQARHTYDEVIEERGAETGDTLLIDYQGSIDGEVKPDMSGTEQRIEIGAGRFIPGFEEQLVGAKAGEHTTVEVVFPEDYASPVHAGKPARFEVDVRKIEKAKPATIDDELGKELGLEGLDELKTRLRERAQLELGQASRMRAKRHLLDKLAELVSFEVPMGMVDLEFDQIWRQVQAAIERGEDNPDKGRPEEELKAEYRAIAERRVRLGLLFADIGRAENIEVTQEELNRALIAEARRHPGQEQQVVEFFRKNPQAIDGLRAPILEEKVVDVILGKVKVIDKAVTREELMRDPDDAAPPVETPPVVEDAQLVAAAAAPAEDEDAAAKG